MQLVSTLMILHKVASDAVEAAACVTKETTDLCVNRAIKHSQENICRVLGQNEKI